MPYSVTKKSVKEDINKILSGQLAVSDDLSETFADASKELAEQSKAGQSLKSALDGAKDSASAFRRAFITKTDVDQPLASLNQVVAGLDADHKPKSSKEQKLVIFTEHKDTLTYLKSRIETLEG